MSAHTNTSEITFQPPHAGGTKRIWRVFWVLSVLTIIELALGYTLYLTHGHWGYGLVISLSLIHI